MKNALITLFAFTFVGTALAVAEIGKPAPDFTATDIHGKAIKLSDYKGKIVVLESYNLDCPFCHNHYSTGAMQALQKEGIPSMIYYKIPLHLQKAYASLGYKASDFPVSEDLSSRIFALPMHPYLKEDEIEKICAVLLA